MLYWSHSIDILDPERASVDGFRPIFFSSQGNVIDLSLVPLQSCSLTYVSGCSATSRDLSLVTAKESRSSSEQINVSCLVFLSTTIPLTRLIPGILVRDNAARKRLKERLGDRSIIM